MIDNIIKEKIWNRTILYEELDDLFGDQNVDRSKDILKLLKEALSDKNGIAIDYLLYAIDKNGISDFYTEILCKIVSVREDWLYLHEDIATLLGRIKSPDSVPFLFQLANDFETSDIHSIPLKSIWALRTIGNKEAIESLEKISQNPDSHKAKVASEQLEYYFKDRESA